MLLPPHVVCTTNPQALTCKYADRGYNLCQEYEVEVVCRPKESPQGRAALLRDSAYPLEGEKSRGQGWLGLAFKYAYISFCPRGFMLPPLGSRVTKTESI